MSRLVPSRPIHARLRRHLGTLPHGLPTALTFTVTVGGLLAGTTILAGAVLQAGPLHEPNRLEAADDPAAAGPPVGLAFDTTTPQAGSATTGLVRPAPATDRQAAPWEADRGTRAAFVADGHPSWGAPSFIGMGGRGGSDDGDDGVDRRGEGDHDRLGDHHRPAPTATPEPDHHRPAPTTTPEPDHHPPASTPTPEPDHHRPAPSPTPTPEPDHHRPAPTPTPEPDHHRPAPSPTPTPEP